jgi:type II secretory pathway component PulK
MIRARAAKPSRGMTVVAVLVCLIIVTLISGAVLKVGLAHRELARFSERRLQAEWLAQSGVERAAARLADDRDYTGETWAISASDLGQSNRAPAGTEADQERSAAAIVAITVERVPGSAARRRIKVQADYPREVPRRSRHTKELTIDLEPG